MLWFCYLCPLCLPLQVNIQIIAVRWFSRQLGCQLLYLLRRKIQSIAGQHAAVHAIATVQCLIIIQNHLIKKFILSDSGIFPVHSIFPAEAAAKNHQPSPDIYNYQHQCYKHLQAIMQALRRITYLPDEIVTFSPEILQQFP